MNHAGEPSVSAARSAASGPGAWPPGILFLSYNGIQEPLMQSQSLPYLRGLVREGVRVSLLTFEKARPPGRPPGYALRESLAREGLQWDWLPYHKRPPLLSTLFDVLRGGVAAFRLARRNRSDVLEARGTIPAAMACPVARLLRRKFLFNVRGLLAEEYADAGRWKPGGCVFRWVSRMEKRWAVQADAVIVLTESLRRLFRKPGYLPRPRTRGVAVIPCCVDTERFRPGPVAVAGRGDAPTFVYAGSLGGYYLVREMFEFFAAARVRWPRARLRVLANGYEGLAYEAMKAQGLDRNQVDIETVPHESVPERLADADVGLLFARPAFARVGMSPTKLAEYLACGLPVVTTEGIGDTDAIVREDAVGVVLQALDAAGYDEAVNRLADLLREGPALRERCRRSAVRRFGLDRGLQGYIEVLRTLGVRR